MNNLTKAECQRRHAMKRARERYDVHLNIEHYIELVKQIQSSQAPKVFKESNRLGHFLVKHGGTEMIAVYDNQRKTIVTFLPFEALKGYHHE
jgi:hypothetical protein